MITQERLKYLLHYDRDTGEFTWNVSMPRVRYGSIAGRISNKGYVQIQLDGIRYSAHRLAFIYINGFLSDEFEIDHLNGVKKDNRFCNLRAVTKSVNQQNRRCHERNNKCGLLGVSLQGNRWKAQITSSGIKVYLGYFNSPEVAHSAYLNAKRRLHEGCTI